MNHPTQDNKAEALALAELHDALVAHRMKAGDMHEACDAIMWADVVPVLKSLAAAASRPQPAMEEMVNRFLSWPLPDTVNSDGCVVAVNYPHPRYGTNLLNADEARQMLEHCLRGKQVCAANTSQPHSSHEPGCPRGCAPGICRAALRSEPCERALAAPPDDLGLMSAVLEILDGRDKGEGVSPEPWESVRRRLIALVAAATPTESHPIDMVLHCPKCGMQHIDRRDPPLSADWDDAEAWTNPPHRSHLCAGCGHIWRPADVPTNGVAAVKTKGKADSPILSPGEVGVEVPPPLPAGEASVAQLSLTPEQVSAVYLTLGRSRIGGPEQPEKRPAFGWMEPALQEVEKLLEPWHSHFHDRRFNAMNRQFFGDARFDTPVSPAPSGPATAEAPPLPEMTASRAVFFLERFKKAEKMLGPNEQKALDFAIDRLTDQPSPSLPVEWEGLVERLLAEFCEASGTYFTEGYRPSAKTRQMISNPIRRDDLLMLILAALSSTTPAAALPAQPEGGNQ